MQGKHRHPRRSPEQPQGLRPDPAAQQAHRLHRPFRLRQISLAFDTLYAEGSGATSNPFPPTRASFWGRWKSRTWTPSTAFLPPSPSTRRPRAKPAFHRRHGDGDPRLSAPALRAQSACRTAPSAAGKSPSRRSIRWSISFSPCRSAPACSSSRRSFAAKKGEHVKILESVVKQGFVRVRIDGEIYDAAEAPALAKQKKHNIEVVVDRLILREDIRTRLTDSLETALSLSGGVVIADIGPGEREMLFSQNLACPDCGISMEELAPRSFSFNSPFGACPTCAGLGMLQKIDPDLISAGLGQEPERKPVQRHGLEQPGAGHAGGHVLSGAERKNTASPWIRRSTGCPKRRWM